ncbi:MAG: hypothetical protein KDH08_19640, partial [Anaerolineae bacterium]|nr:hypothetical protein [Anaerolineae bacterium]
HMAQVGVGALRFGVRPEKARQAVAVVALAGHSQIPQQCQRLPPQIHRLSVTFQARRPENIQPLTRHTISLTAVATSVTRFTPKL